MAAQHDSAPGGSPSGARTAPPGEAGDGLRLFSVSGVPVYLAPSWWLGSLVVVVLYAPLVERLLPGAGAGLSLALAASFAVLLGVSVLAHELGHTLVAVRLGMPVRRLKLYLLGGLSEVVRTPRKPREEGLVAAAGPVVSLILAGGFGLLLLVVPPGASWLLVAQCAVANLAVAVFNVLPGLPLDGGRMLRAGVWALTGRRAIGTRAAVVGGWLVTVVLAGWAVWGLMEGSQDRWLRLAVSVITGWFVVTGAHAELVGEQQRRQWPAELDVRKVMRPVLQLPAESPVSAAWEASAGRGVVLVRADGVAAGLLDGSAARRLAEETPNAPAELAAEPVRPESVLLVSEPGDEIAARVRETPAVQFLVVDDDG